MRLLSSVVEAGDLTAADRGEMFALMQRCYENVRRDCFEEDLNRKWMVIALHEPVNGRLVGFSTQVVLKMDVNGSTVQALFSGDTVVEPENWGDTALAHEWGQFAVRLIDELDSNDLYWFLTSKGFRTYRYLPLFFREFWPRSNGKCDARIQGIIDSLGHLVGGRRYNTKRGVIHSSHDQYFVRRAVGEPGMRAQRNPHVNFFLELNPGSDQGDELCCLAPLTRENFTRAAYRMINAHTREREAI